MTIQHFISIILNEEEKIKAHRTKQQETGKNKVYGKIYIDYKQVFYIRFEHWQIMLLSRIPESIPSDTMGLLYISICLFCIPT